MSVAGPTTSGSAELVRALFYDDDRVKRRHQRVLNWAIGVTLSLLFALLVASLVLDWQVVDVWRFEAAGLFGALVGTAELVSRYRDAPSFAVLSKPGVGYIMINAVASVGALGVILAFDWKFGATGAAAEATQVLVAGFGAMALFRSSLLTVKAGSDDVGIGPSSVLSVLMAASDRSADRLRAADRAGRVRTIMADVSYPKAKGPLPTIAIALMQNLSSGDAAALNADLDALDNNQKLPDQTKCVLLGLKLTNIVSTEVLIAAKETLGPSILVSEDGERPLAQAEPTNAVEEIVGAAEQQSASAGLPQTPQTPSPKPEAP